MKRHVAPALALALFAALPAGATAAPQINVAVNPGTLLLDRADRETLVVTNAGDVASTIDVGVGNYSIAEDGSVQVDPRLEPSRSAKRWLTVSPSVLNLGPRQSAVVTVTSKAPHIAAPGDHHALVLLTGRASGQTAGAVQVRARVGVGTLVRVPGELRRHLQVHRLSVHRAGSAKVVRLGVTNKGNVNERLARGQARVVLRRNGRVIARLTTRTRSLLPGTSGVISFPYTGRLTGRIKVTATLRPTATVPGIAATASPIVRRASLTF